MDFPAVRPNAHALNMIFSVHCCLCYILRTWCDPSD